MSQQAVMIMILSKSKYHNMAVTYRVPHKMPQMLASETNLNKYNVIKNIMNGTRKKDASRKTKMLMPSRKPNTVLTALPP